MRDDLEFNIRFISLLEENPCLYDHTSDEYSKKNLQDLSWNKISNELKESVSDCKDRWKNLRGAFTRHLKHTYSLSGSAKKKRPYYLAEYMTFLLPFTKSRQPKSSISSPAALVNPLANLEDGESDSGSNRLDEITDEQVEQDLQSESEDGHKFMLFPKRPRMSPDKSSVSTADVNRTALEYFEGRTANINELKCEDPDMLFLLSVLPDMKKMSDSQKRRFKISILSSADNILEESINNW